MGGSTSQIYLRKEGGRVGVGGILFEEGEERSETATKSV